MAFHVVYVAGGELDKVKKVNYVDRIRNFAYLSQPYNVMPFLNMPAIAGVYKIEYTSPEEEMELLSITVTCTGYGEDDYYYLYVNDELWFDKWFPTEVKEGLYIGTSTYVYKLHPKSKFTMFYVNMSGTSKKVWLGIRMLGNKKSTTKIEAPIIDTREVSEPTFEMTISEIVVPKDTYYDDEEEVPDG